LALKDRIHGYSFSEIEKELIFNRENCGYARSAHSSGILLFLDPSPFLNTPKREYFLFECMPPKVGELISAHVTQIKEHIEHERNRQYCKYNVKVVDSWEPLDPNSLLKQKRLLEPAEIESFFSQQYRGEEENVKGIATCSALYAMSSPPNEFEAGGVNAALLGDRNGIAGFKRSIPTDFRKISSPFFYKISSKESFPNFKPTQEINLAYINPEKTPMHIPIPFSAEITAPIGSRLNMECISPIITGYLLDSLMIQPVIPESLESMILDISYDLINDIKEAGYIPYNQDFSSLIPRLSQSFARLQSHLMVGTQDIREVVNIWSDMVFEAHREMSTEHSVKQLYTLGGHSKKLYLDLLDIIGADNKMLITELIKLIKLDPDSLKESIEELNRCGLIIITPKKEIRVLEFKSEETKSPLSNFHS